MHRQKRRAIYLVLLAFIVIGVLVALLYFIQVRTNRENAYRASTLLIDQIKQVVETNDDNLRSLTASLRDDYVTRAKAVSYIIDKNPEIEKQITELAWLTNLFSIDEIHLFDAEGNMYSGTKPGYYGENLKTSERFGAFAKMIDEKNFTMCQSVTDESGALQMMYAICWNDAHNRMVMVGVEPMRLLNELAMSQMDAVIKEIPAYEGVEILVANDKDNMIVGATNETYIGVTLDSLGFDVQDLSLNNVYRQETIISGENSYCAISRYDKYKIVIAQYRSVVNNNIPIPLLIISVYMIIAAVLIVFITIRMTRKIINEHKNATQDALTSFANRRAYEDDIKRYDEGGYEPTLVYVSMDLNGLKVVNDSKGHEAGDKLLVGAATCMHQCFGNYGKLYRIGGDEFAALIFADEDRLTMLRMDFEEAQNVWTAENEMELSISCGYVRVIEHMEMSFSEIAGLADDRMYEAKNLYYRKRGYRPTGPGLR